MRPGQFVPADRQILKDRVISPRRPAGKKSDIVVLPEVDFNNFSATVTEECLESMSIFCSNNNVTKTDQKLSGCTGPCGVNTLML